MDGAIIKQNKSDEAGRPVPCRSSSLAALSRLLARQAAREFLNDAGTDGVPREFVDEDRGLGDMSRPASRPRTRRFFECGTGSRGASG